MSLPSDDALRHTIRQFVERVDLESTGIKKFVKMLSREYNADLSSKSKFIKQALTEILNEADEEEEEEEDTVEEASSEEEEEEEEEAPAQATKKPKRKAAKASGGARGGLAAVKEISDGLASFLGKGKHMARTEVVKSLWEYIKENDLQNPENRREILLDDAMQQVFQVDRFTMFQMNKYIGAHIDPYKPVDLTTNSTAPKKRKSTAKGKKEKKKRKGGGGLQAPYQLSPELARVVGRQILPRPRVVKKLWEYIRENGLQDPNDRRNIICDNNMKLVMNGQSVVTIFSMQKCISPHLLEKLDKSYYTPSDVEIDDQEDGEESDE